MKENAGRFPVAVMCQVLQASPSGYYDWRDRGPSERRQRRERIAQAVRRSFIESRAIYGHRKVYEDLMEEKKIAVCKETVRLIMREEGLRSKVRRKFVVTTDSRHDQMVHANHLERDFTAEAPNRKWVADITYIRTQEGWLYLAAVMDLYSRMIVGWAFSAAIDAALVHHSDRGVQYQNLLSLHRILCSMSRNGDCWDNACMESFFGKLKSEHIRGRSYPTREEAKRDLFWYLEIFYNRIRRHASLGYMSPADFEARASITQAA